MVIFFRIFYFFFLEVVEFGQKQDFLLLKAVSNGGQNEQKSLKKPEDHSRLFTTTIYKKTSLHDYLLFFNGFAHIDKCISHSS